MTRARSLSQLANSNVFSVDANNSRVGIGSTVPTVKLDVGGDMNVSGTLTYEDVTNVETTGIITAAQLVVTGVGATFAGISTFLGDIQVGDKIIHTGDTNTAIRFPAADTFTVETAGSERVRVDSSGNVGIGSATPQRALDISGSVTISRNLVQIDNISKVFNPSHLSANREAKIRFGLEDGSFAGIEVQNTVGSSGAHNSQNVHIINHNGGIAGDTYSLTARFDGRIGIGSTNPQVDLAVRGDSQATVAIAKEGLTVKDSGDLHSTYDTLQIGAGGALLSYSQATATADTQFVHNAYRHSGGNFKYRYADTAARIRMNSPGGEIIFDNAASGSADADITFSERLRIDSDGGVGIGTTNPVLGRLQVERDIGIYRASSDPTLNFAVGGTSGSPTKTYRILIDDDDSDKFQVRDSNTARITLDGNGDVGIGTANPQDKFEVHGANSSIFGIFSRSTTRWITLHSGSTDPAIFTNAEADIRMGHGSARDAYTTNRLVLDPGGNGEFTGICTATQLFEGTTRVASTGKAIAMAMLFG